MNRGEIYKCPGCGCLTECLSDCGCQEGRCGDPVETHTEDKGYEKHVPVVERTEKGIRVKIGSVPHPMEKEHWIQWIEVIDGDSVYRRYLNPGESPEAEFPVANENVVVREHCNVHGLWMA